jgi:ligand-binding SRPBCC domain-containing protein
MFIHTLRRSQVIPATMEQAWDFFSNPRNLTKITPPSMGFEIMTSPLAERIYAGMMIEYRVRPLLGLPMPWLTEITHVAEPHFFVDEQRVGPYAIWHHEHHFKQLSPGLVEVSDIITYRLPFQPFGELVHRLMVAPQLEAIFAHREIAMKQIFPEKQA